VPFSVEYFSLLARWLGSWDTRDRFDGPFIFVSLGGWCMCVHVHMYLVLLFFVSFLCFE
jgi:hypothetical protein